MRKLTQWSLALETAKTAAVVTDATRDMPPFHEFMQKHLPENILAGIMSFEHGLNTPGSVAMTQAIYVAAVFHKARHPLFRFNKDLVLALRATDLPDLPVEDLRLPFEGICIEFPKNVLNSPSEHIERVYMTAVENDRFRVVMLDEEANTTHYVNIDLKMGKTLMECIANQEAAPVDSSLSEAQLQAFEDNKVYANYWQADFFRIAINAAIYITSLDADVVRECAGVAKLKRKLKAAKSPDKKARFQDLLRRAESRNIFIVGAKFRATKEFYADYTEAGRKWLLTKRFRVMGHWRMQAYGKGGTLRKRIWVKPYWKGPAFSELLARSYVVR